MKLSKNFELKEFTTSAGIVIKPTSEQVFCVTVLANNVLQPIRETFGPIKITSGLRNDISDKILRDAGYPASKTSDHFGWSKENPRGTGAADIICSVQDLTNVFHWIIAHLMPKIGQVIYYPSMNVIHVSNRFSEIFTMPDTRSEETRIQIYKAGKFLPYRVN